MNTTTIRLDRVAKSQLDALKQELDELGLHCSYSELIRVLFRAFYKYHESANLENGKDILLSVIESLEGKR